MKAKTQNILGFSLGEDSDGIIDFQEIGIGFTIDLNAMKENKCYWAMIYGQPFNFAKKNNQIQFWEPEPILKQNTKRRKSIL